MYIVQINTENQQDGCYQARFDALNDDVREFVKASAAALRSFNANKKCNCTILKNGDSLKNARVLPC